MKHQPDLNGTDNDPKHTNQEHQDGQRGHNAGQVDNFLGLFLKSYGAYTFCLVWGFPEHLPRPTIRELLQHDDDESSGCGTLCGKNKSSTEKYLGIRARYIRKHVLRQTGKRIRFTASHVGRFLGIHERRCAYCGTTEGRFVIEHVVPMSRGGETKFHNLVLACQKCNDDKLDMTLGEWKHAPAKVERRLVKNQTTMADFVQ